MAFRSFRVNCTLRVVLLAATTLVFSLLLGGTQYLTLGFCGLLIVYQTYALVRYVERTSRDLDRFLQAIEFSDFSLRVSRIPAGKPFAELRATYDRILSRFQEMSLVQEENLRYLHAVVRHIPIGVLAFEPGGAVDLLSSAAKALVDVPALRHVDDLAAVHPELHARLRALEPGQRALVTVSVHDELRQISLHASELGLRRKTLTLVSLHNISPELNEKEMEAWQNLIRVLTHEIKNSLTPIASLASSVERLALSRDGGQPPQADKIRDALEIIQRRSRGLLQFVDTYRDLTHLPRPQFRVCAVRELFRRVEKLIAPQVQTVAGRQVALRTVVEPESMVLTADPEMIEQVLINLALNALEATAEQEVAELTLEARSDERSRPVIRVTDNGPGIVAESLEKVFVPFYSTKKQGSGIGLSLSRQIMRLHRGDLTVNSEPGVRTTFTLRF